MVVPDGHVRVIERLAQNMFICPPHVSQIAALAAMDCDAELQSNLDVYRANRALMLKGLPKAGFTKIAPLGGAFYVYADVSDLTDDSLAFASEILDKAGVAVTLGLDCDPVRGAGRCGFPARAPWRMFSKGCPGWKGSWPRKREFHSTAFCGRFGPRAVREPPAVGPGMMSRI